jgi:hypothetical protein
VEVNLNASVVRQTLENANEETDGAVVKEDEVITRNKLLQFSSLAGHKQIS